MKDTTKMAFPTNWDDKENVQEGMSLRDFFAAHAIVACPLHQVSDKASWAYRMADAMMEARK